MSGPGRDVNSDRDLERRSPPFGQSGQDTFQDDHIPEVPAGFDLYFNDGQYLGNNFANQPTSAETGVLETTEFFDEEWMQQLGMTAQGADDASVVDHSLTMAGTEHRRNLGSNPTVNTGSGDLDKASRGTAVLTGQQTTAIASYDPTDAIDPQLNQASPYLPFYPEYPPYGGIPNTFDTPYPGQLTRPMSEPFGYPDFAGNNTQPAQPATSPPAEPTQRPRRRRRASTDSMQSPEPSRQKRQCAGCDKVFYTSKDPAKQRCSRCYDKHVKHTAGHTTYVFDPNMTIRDAWNRLYPQVQPFPLPGDDLDTARTFEQDYIRRLIEAISVPYASDASGSKEDQQRVAQQSKLNKKPFDSAQYRDDLVNARTRFVFHTALSYHGGGQSFYDTGGDNSGYGEDRTLKFSDRIERIIELLTLDKDIAMDVIEGRGVTALVHNPNKYERRKRDNKKSNDTKQDLQAKGKQLEMLAGSPGLASVASAPVLSGAPDTSQGAGSSFQPQLQAQPEGGDAFAFAGGPFDDALFFGDERRARGGGAGAGAGAGGGAGAGDGLNGYVPARFG